MEAGGSDLIGSGAFFGYLAGILLVSAILMTSIRALRIFALGAGVAAIAYFITRNEQSFALILAVLFVLANGVQLLILMNRSRTGNALTEEQALFTHLLAIDSPQHQRRLRDLLEWRDVRSGHVLMDEGQRDPALIYIADGSALIEHAGKDVGICGKGEFLGEMSLVSGEKATATVTAREAMRIAVFDRDALGHFAREVPEIGNALSAALNRGLAAKVSRMNVAGEGDAQ